MRHQFIRFIPFGLALTVVGCADKPQDESSPAACSTDNQCQGEQICVDRMCVVSNEEPEDDGEDGDDDGSGFVSPGDSEGGEDDNADGNSGPMDDTGPAGCTDGPTCQADDAIAVCQSGEQTVFDCADVCAQRDLGPPTGCGFSEDEGTDVCFCEAKSCGEDPGGSCEVNGDCCNFGTTSAGCVNFPTGAVCSDRCETNSGCNSDCCQPLQANGQAVGYGACSAPELCVTGSCDYAFCEYSWCGTVTANDCPADYSGDGTCDCGCQFFDLDCQ